MILTAVGLIVFAVKGDGNGAMAALASGTAGALTLSIELAGPFMLWSGLFKVAEKAGLTEGLSLIMRKPLSLIMPDLGDAAAPISLNLAANFFGLGNAATPFGIEAVKRLDRGDGRASDSMAMFIALNSSAVELLPTSVIAVRAACGSADPYSIVAPTFISSVAAAITAVVSAKLLGKVFK